jgi:hypothetical protein
MLRDPNRPRRNPLFDEVDTTSFDVPGARPRHPLLSSVPTGGGYAESEHETDRGRAPEDDTTRPDATDEPAGGAELGVGGLLDALVGAGPETAEHLLRAMHELLLAAQTVIEAAERGMDQRGEPGRREPRPGPTGVDEPPSGRVRRIDLD